jgi:predicted nucleic acid-binding Zn ribbon protein
VSAATACVQCHGPLPEGAHPNTQTCSVECRVARRAEFVASERAKRHEAAGPRICQLQSCGQAIPAERNMAALFCSESCKNTATWERQRAKRDARAAEAAAAEAAGTVPATRHARGSRNSEAKEQERGRKAAIRADLGLRLWQRERAIVEAWRGSAEPASATTATA